MRISRRLAPVVVAVLTVAACGGSGDLDGATDGPVVADADELSRELPDDFYLPADMVVGLITDTDAATSVTGKMGSGDAESVQADMVAGLQAAGYELLSNDGVAVFAKNGVGRVRVSTSVVIDDVTVSIDIDKWTDEQLDEMRALVGEPTMVAGQAVAVVAGVTYEAVGECRLQGTNRMFSSDDASVTVQIDETQDPPRVYADATTPEGVVYGTEFDADLSFSSSDQEMMVSGVMTDYSNESADPVEFTATATCDAG